MARVFKKRGIWWIDYRADGRRRRESIGASCSLAREVLVKRLADATERKYFPARATNATSFSTITEKYWTLHGPNVRARSWYYMQRVLVVRFGNRRASQITAADVQAYLNEIIASGRAPGTANRHLTLLSAIFNKAKEWGDFYGDNPCATVKKFRETNHRLRYLSLGEIDRLMRSAHPRLRPILTCALWTGMRKGELLSLRWENVDLERGLIYLLTTKSGRPREIPIANSLKPVLESLGPQPNGSVFNLPDIMLRRYFASAMKETNISGFRFHDLRHTFASHFLMGTGDLPTLQRLLGHSTPMLTLRYAHLSQAHLSAGMARFEAGMAFGAPETAGQGCGSSPGVLPPVFEAPLALGESSTAILT